MSDYLFAYGTLQPGHAPKTIAHLAAMLRPVGEGLVRGVLYDLGRYPGAVADQNAGGTIRGTVMELPEDKNVLQRLDEYEGFDPESPETSEFVRQRQMVQLRDGSVVECWFYRYNGKLDATRVIMSGVWRGGRDRED